MTRVGPGEAMTAAVTWSQAWSAASRQFWRAQSPEGHFATSAGGVLADELARIVLEVDDRLGSPLGFTVLDLGAGDGSLLEAVRDRCPELRSRARWIGVDVRPIHRDGVMSLVQEVPGPLPLAGLEGVVMAHEWLDEMPCDVVERDHAGDDRLVLLAGTREFLGPSLRDRSGCAAHGVDADAARAWLDRWWPLDQAGQRAEVGIPRDEGWTWMAGLLQRGMALATDYGHRRQERTALRRRGSLRAYRSGHICEPLADGSVGITADVAVDACAAAVPGTTIIRQRDALGDVRIDATSSPVELARYFELIRLRNPAGPGGFHWLRWVRW
jgi:SAM-dependent MidA family methyltransferase